MVYGVILNMYSHTQVKFEDDKLSTSNYISKTGMDYRTWLQNRKQEENKDDSECALGSKFEITRKTNSTILEESSKAEEDEESVLEKKPHHRATNSKTINPMLLMTNNEQTMQLRTKDKPYCEEKEISQNSIDKELYGSQNHYIKSQNSFSKIGKYSYNVFNVIIGSSYMENSNQECSFQKKYLVSSSFRSSNNGK